MKTNIKHFLLAMVAMATFSLTACKKTDQAKTTTNFLTTTPWKAGVTDWKTTDGAWVAPASFANIDFYPGIILTFFANGGYTLEYNGSGGSGVWTLSADNKSLTLVNSGGSSSTFTVATLTSGTLQLTTELDPKATYTIQYTANNMVFTYYNTQRATFTH
jgi:hypothetical protein